MAIPVIAWVALGALGAYAVTRSSFQSELRHAKKRAKDMIQLPEGLDRLPRPDYAVEIPESKKDINAVDILICEAFEKSVPRENQDLYVLRELYPDFPWPAIYADHPTTQQLQGIVRFRLDQAYAMIPDDEDASEQKFCSLVSVPGNFDPGQ
jgi:hypothetical protein